MVQRGRLWNPASPCRGLVYSRCGRSYDTVGIDGAFHLRPPAPNRIRCRATRGMAGTHSNSGLLEVAPADIRLPDGSCRIKSRSFVGYRFQPYVHDSRNSATAMFFGTSIGMTIVWESEIGPAAVIGSGFSVVELTFSSVET